MGNNVKELCCVVLAAGEGKRMHASHSKVLCTVAFKPMLAWVVDAAKNSGIDRICVVAGSDDVMRAAQDCVICEQTERLGTGHAVMCANDFLLRSGADNTLILCGDAPFIDPETIGWSLKQHIDDNNDVTVITAMAEVPGSLPRAVRSGDRLASILTEGDCTPETQALHEVVSGAYWFKTDCLLAALSELKNDNKEKEYRLSDTVEILSRKGGRCGCFTAANSDIALGANSPAELLRLNEVAARRALDRHLDNGVQFVSRDGILIGPDVDIAPGARIMPGSILYGSTKVGAGSVIGPNSLLCDSTVGENTQFNASQGYSCSIGSNVTIGPFVHIRPDSVICDKVKIGDFVEVKNSTVGEGTSLAHLTYVGDADVGKHCNFGCGVVFVNYDGESKSRNTVGDYAFVGCNTNLIAPVRVGNGAYTAAGSTITKDVPDGALAIERGQQHNVEGWAAKKLRKYIEKKSK